MAQPVYGAQYPPAQPGQQVIIVVPGGQAQQMQQVQQPQYVQQQHMRGATSFDGVAAGGNYGNGSGNDAVQNAVAEAEEAVRRGFVSKVFAIVFIQLAVTFGTIALFSFQEDVQNFVFSQPQLLTVSIVVVFGSVIVLSCCSDFARTHPNGMIVLTFLTLAMSYLLGVIAATRAPEQVLMASGVTLGLVIVLGLFAKFSSYDMTSKGPYLLVALVVFLFFSIILMFVQESREVRTAFAAIGVLLFGFFLVYDIQLVIGGKHHKYQLSPDEYVFAAVNIYLDVVNILLYVLILGDAAS